MTFYKNVPDVNSQLSIKGNRLISIVRLQITNSDNPLIDSRQITKKKELSLEKKKTDLRLWRGVKTSPGLTENIITEPG